MRITIQAIILLFAVQAGVGELRAQDAAAGAGISVEERLERIETMLSNQGLLELVQQLQSLEQEISRLRGQAEEQHHALEQLKKRQRDLYTDIDTRLQRIETPVTGVIGAADSQIGPPLQTLSPFEGTEVAGGQQADTPLTLELVDQVGDEPAAASTAAQTVPPAATPAQPTGPDSDPQRVAEAAVSAAAAAAAATVPPAATTEQPAEPGNDPQRASEPAIPAPETSGATVADAPGQGAGQQAAQSVVATAPAAVDPALIEAAYRHAFDLLKQSLYGPAINAFREFLARYPDSEYAGSAQFWVAEAYYVNSRFNQALAEYSALVQRYPDSAKLVQAKLKAAFCQLELGQVDAAKRQLDDIIQQYPGTTAASLARDRLADIAAPPIPADSAPSG